MIRTWDKHTREKKRTGVDEKLRVSGSWTSSIPTAAKAAESISTIWSQNRILEEFVEFSFLGVPPTYLRPIACSLPNDPVTIAARGR